MAGDNGGPDDDLNGWPHLPATMFFFKPIFNALALFLIPSASVVLDIHLPLKYSDGWNQGCPYDEALRSNLALIRNTDPALDDAGERINFFEKHMPHVTLYLTNFDIDDVINGSNVINGSKLEPFLDSLENVSSALHKCNIQLASDYSVRGMYAMIGVNAHPLEDRIAQGDAALIEADCLRTASDALVGALSKYMRRPPNVPDWVNQLPEPERTRKLELIHQHGSPNIFEEFVPHITVGYSPLSSSEKRKDLMQELAKSAPRPCEGVVTVICAGLTGEGGSVLLNGTVGEDMPLSDRNVSLSITTIQ